MINWILLIKLYFVAGVGAIIHEVAHFGKIHIKPLLFTSYTTNAKIHGFWTLIPELIIFGLIVYLNPNFIYLKYLGLVLFAHFTLSTILGALFGHEGRDVNKGNILVFIVGVFVLIYFWSYYYPIFLDILNNLFT